MISGATPSDAASPEISAMRIGPPRSRALRCPASISPMLVSDCQVTSTVCDAPAAKRRERAEALQPHGAALDAEHAAWRPAAPRARRA